MKNDYPSLRDFAPERRKDSSEQDLTAKLLEGRLKTDTWRASVHGKEGVRALGGFAVTLALSAAISFSGAEPTLSSSVDDKVGSARAHQLPAPIDQPVLTLDASGLDPQQYSQQISHYVGPYSNEQALSMARNVAQMTAGANPAVAINFYNQDFCLLYQSSESENGYEGLHRVLDAGAPYPSAFLESRFSRMSDQLKRRHQGLSEAIGNHDDGRHVVLHELQHCYVGQAIHQIREHLEGGNDLNALGLTGPTYDLGRYVSQVYADAHDLSKQYPQLTKEKLVEVTLSQLEESVADVFATLALHQQDGEGQMRRRLERLVMFRDLERQVGSTHDSVNALLSMLKTPNVLGRVGQQIPAAISWTEAGASAVIAEVDKTGFEALSQLAIEHSVASMGPPVQKMRQIHYFEIADANQVNANQALSWGRSREMFAANKPQAEQLNRIRQRLMPSYDPDDDSPEP